ncbi:DUF4894 domain-containing protein [Thermotoga sp. KOL6]|uniref:DUF4894 domain-containing protein n=1 Tax=Thermotoga sp. KOL6 TaxID=126741 RepID=UPI000C755E04|nr:DUF4894 domain-containing protein [Thermotoga sp. KOL6]PLV58319.1 hypothetical protein AS005_08095 [Thermotoga sp. KOL6]
MRALRIIFFILMLMYGFLFVKIFVSSHREMVTISSDLASNLIENFNIHENSIIIDSRKPIGVVLYKGNYYLVSEKGILICSLPNWSFLKFYPLFLGVKLEGIRFSEEDKNILTLLNTVLKSSLISAVLFDSKEVVLLKGARILVEDWVSFVKNFDVIESQYDAIEPRGEYFLSSEGILMEMRGD